jgi:hypothetical protein
MSTKFFYWDGGVADAVAAVTYIEGAPVEYGIQKRPIAAIQGWHGIPAARRIEIIARLIAAGWIEGEQSKPDE